MLIDGYLVHETPAAWLVDIEGDEIWLPKSQCVVEDDYEPLPGDTCTWFIPEWLADKKGLSAPDMADGMDMLIDDA